MLHILLQMMRKNNSVTFYMMKKLGTYINKTLDLVKSHREIDLEKRANKALYVFCKTLNNLRSLAKEWYRIYINTINNYIQWRKRKSIICFAKEITIRHAFLKYDARNNTELKPLALFSDFMKESKQLIYYTKNNATCRCENIHWFLR